MTCAVIVSAQLASPSETVSVSEAVPGVLHVKLGFCADALSSEPPVACQA